MDARLNQQEHSQLPRLRVYCSCSLEIERNKGAIDSDDVNAAFELMLEIVLQSSECLAARVRPLMPPCEVPMPFKHDPSSILIWTPADEMGGHAEQLRAQFPLEDHHHGPLGAVP